MFIISNVVIRAILIHFIVVVGILSLSFLLSLTSDSKRVVEEDDPGNYPEKEVSELMFVCLFCCSVVFLFVSLCVFSLL